MRTIKLCFVCICVSVIGFSQNWMTSLPVAQSLALVENKLILMVWEDDSYANYPVLIEGENGKPNTVFELFNTPELNPIIWQYFVPVIVSEATYDDWYNKLKPNHSQAYMDKFNDFTPKVLDVNGHIINVNSFTENYVNLSKIIRNYGISTRFLSAELMAYNTNKDFYTTYFLASKYLDFTLFVNKSIRKQIIKLAQIYIDKAEDIANADTTTNQLTLQQRAKLLSIQYYIVNQQPFKAFRKLKRIDVSSLQQANTSYYNMLNYVVHISTKRYGEAENLKEKLSGLQLKKAQWLINFNK